MFKFANGRKLDSRRTGFSEADVEELRKINSKTRVKSHPAGFTDHEILEIHVANCAGENKRTWEGRLQWVKDHRSLIEAVADNPKATQSEWQDFDDPFCFVAACKELVAAWNDPNFVSCLPVFFDGTANGYQHWSALVRDRELAEKVNVVGNKKNDLYADVVNALKLNLEDATGEHADSWRKKYATLNLSRRRTLVKQPTMTFVYGVEEPGMTLQIWKEYDEMFPGEEVPKGYFGFIQGRIDRAIRKELPGAYDCREYLRNLTARTLDKGRFVQSISPTGFPLVSSYLERETVPVYAHDGGRMRVKTGETDKVLRDDAIRSTAPNFTHSLDAAHLIRVALRAAEAGIPLTTNHDCFGTLAGDAADLNRIIRREFFLLHRFKWLVRLHEQNDPDGPLPPQRGWEFEDENSDGEYSWS
jgi:DNA-directed RNA polymerase